MKGPNVHLVQQRVSISARDGDVVFHTWCGENVRKGYSYFYSDAGCPGCRKMIGAVS